MLRRFRGILIVTLLLSVPATAVADVNYIYYVAQKVKWGSAEQLVVMPRTFQASADMTASGLAAEAFHKLKSYRGAVYSDANLTLDPDFRSTAAVSVTCGKSAATELHIIVSEIYWTLKANGVREIRFPEVGKYALKDSTVPLGNAMLVMQLWQVLPPARPGSGFVLVEGQLMSARKARKKVEARALASAVHALLESPTPFVRLRVVVALNRLKWAASEAALLPLLKDKDTAVKKAVLKGFHNTKSTRVLRALEAVVKNDPDPTIKSIAVRILNRAGIKKFAVFELFEKLRSSDDGEVMDAVAKLGKENKPEVAMVLIEVLVHRNAQVQKLAMAGIVGLNNLKAFLKIMAADNIGMNFRNQAATLLSKGNDGNGDKGLLHLLANGSQAIKINVIGQVAKRRRYRLVGRVIESLKADDSNIRVAATEALLVIKDSKALGPLSDAVRADKKNAHLHKRTLLAILGDLSREEVIKRSSAKDTLIRQLAIKTLFKFTEGGRPHPSVLHVLKQRLGDTDKAIRRSAAFALARINDIGVVRSLLKLRNDPDGAIREQVAVAVGGSKLANADKLLLEMLKDTNPGTKRAAVAGLRKRGVKSALQKLRFLANHRDPRVRREVMQAIVVLAGAEGWDSFFGIWQTALFDMDPVVKSWAAKGMALRRDPRVPSLLGALVTDMDKGVQLTALAGLGKSGQPTAVEYIARGLMDEKREVKIAALDALAALNLEGAKIPLREFVKNESDKELVAKANQVYDNLP
jgi:HEAT repeat protein